MPDTFEIATDAPVAEYVAGQLVTFPVLLVDDLLPWCAELKAQWRRQGEARLDPKMDPFALWRARKHLDDIEATLDNLQERARTPAGAKRILLLSLKKAGRTDDEAKAIAAAVLPYRLADLATAVSRLLPPPVPFPNAGAGGGADAGSGQTGST